jgi:PEP-CTERM motif
MQNKLVIAGFLGAGLLLAQQTQANLILNGDFENNTAGVTVFNVSAGSFTYLPTVTEYGSADEIDIINDGSFGLSPQSGLWKLGLHTQTGGAFDAFTLGLSTPIVAGNSYTLSFYSASETASPVNGLAGNVIIGLSGSSNGSSSTQIFAPATAPNQWTLYSTTFVAPVNATYLTVRSGSVLGSYNSVDNFSLEAVPEPGAVALLLIGGVAACYGARRR